MESAEQPTINVHQNLRKPLEQLGHHQVSTIPPNEGPVVKEDLQGYVEDVAHSASSALEQVVNGGVTQVRTTEGHRGFSIARGKQFLKEKIKLWK